ncbi:MAG: zinc ribbon domain-containing protein, partial [Propionibacteriaceae bacterium]|nr:zinc ribbon domain-containing protein [Propionibacteriaceae bacterium]
MALCPNGHQSQAQDFCDTCGTPLAGAAVIDLPVAPARTVTCPNCHTLNVPQALFCESCGYDFMTGQVAADPWAAGMPSSSALNPYPAPESATPAGIGENAPMSAAAEAAALAQVIQAYQADNPPNAGQPVETGAVPEAAENSQPDADPQPPLEWIAELWIDPDWYELEGSPDPLPSPGLPDIVPLVRQNNLIGRASSSKQT